MLESETLVEIARTYNVSHMTISRVRTQHAAP
jgi:DNA-binding LacI/PurR family transcriptional regulator